MNIDNLKGRTIWFGPVRLIFTKTGLVLVCPPRAEDGWADHLTLVLPDGDEDPSHDFAPHLTRRTKGNRKRRQDLSDGGVSLADLHRTMEEFEREILAYWLTFTRPANLELFELADYWVAAMRPDDPRITAMFSNMLKCFERGEDVPIGLPNLIEDLEHLNLAVFDIMLDSLRSPLDLDDCKDILQPLPLLRFSDEAPLEQIGTLSYFPRGLPTGDWSPGWYLTHSNWMSAENVKQWLPGFGGGKLMRAMETIMQAFGHAPASATEAPHEGGSEQSGTSDA